MRIMMIIFFVLAGFAAVAGFILSGEKPPVGFSFLVISVFLGLAGGFAAESAGIFKG